MKTIFAVILATLWTACSGLASERSFRITLHVINEENQPVSGADVGATYENMSVSDGPGHFVTPRALSDDRGMVTLNGKMFLNRVAYGAAKDGYYQTTGLKYRFSEGMASRWEPWNPTIEIVLKKIRSPVPMFSKRLADRLPEIDKPVGYDLEAGDWVAPLGKGHTADFIFVGKLAQRGEQDFDWELNVSFSNPGDGLQRFEPGSATGGSELRSPHEVPLDGYITALKLVRSRRARLRDQTTFKPDGGYFFRVRTELDAQGRVVKAWYGKIYGDFFDMVYYLNPDGTRNVEFDPKRNLFHPAKPDDSAFWNLGP